MSKHTPGPWKVLYSVDGTTVDTARPVRFNLTTAGTAVICKVALHDDAEHFSGEDNARLIAAAPEMLSALKVAEDYLREAAGAPMLAKALREVIAKAEGA